MAPLSLNPRAEDRSRSPKGNSKGTTKVPKIVQTLRERLGGKTEVTQAELKAILDGKEMNLLQSTFRQAMTPSQKQVYMNMPAGDEQRKLWLLQFVVDPKGSIATGFNSTEAFNGQTNVADEAWVTEAQLAGPKWLNSAEHASIMCKSGTMDERPHEEECMCTAGVKHYYASKKKLQKNTGWKAKAGVRCEHELKPEEYSEVNDAICGGQVGQVVRRQPKQRSREEAEASKQAKDAKAKRAAALQRCKKACDRVRDGINSARKNLEIIITTKGYPDAMGTFINGLLDEVQLATDTCKDVHNNEIIKIEQADVDSAKLDKAAEELSNVWSSWLAAHGNAIAKLATPTPTEAPPST